MNTAPQQSQQQNFADFWQSSSSAPSMPSSFFYPPSVAQRPPVGTQNGGHPPPSPASGNANGGPQQSSSLPTSTDPSNGASASTAAFQSSLQPNRPPPFPGTFDVFGTDRAATAPSIQHPSFRPPPIGTASHFQTGGAGHFAQNFPAGLLHPAGPNVPFPSVVASVGFDCMGLMNNFGLNHSVVAPSQSSSQFAVPHPLQSSSAALMPLAMSAIYATGGCGIQRSSSFLNNSSATTSRFPLPLGQSASTGALTSGANGNLQPNTAASQLFDLSNQVAANAGSAASVIAAAVSSAAGATFSPQQLVQPKTSNSDGTGGQRAPTMTAAFGGAFSAVKSETERMPKETATIPLESSSREGASTSSGGAEQRAQAQMSCQVCHLAASNGLHFGARTCAACAAFFRRSISDQKRYICKRSQRCVIRPSECGTQGYRKMCRNCRMKRCLEIGMLPESQCPSFAFPPIIFTRLDVQNKRNKREYYFVDALNNAIQQTTGAAAQQRRQQDQIVGMGGEGGQQDGQLMAKNGLGKLLGPSILNGGNVQQAHQPSLPTAAGQLNSIEKFEPIEKESPPIGNGGVNHQIGQSFQPALPHQAHLLAPALMGGLNPLSSHFQQSRVGGGEVKGAEGRSSATIYSIPTTTTTTTNQQQQQHPMVAQGQHILPPTQFPWGITTTLREI